MKLYSQYNEQFAYEYTIPIDEIKTDTLSKPELRAFLEDKNVDLSNFDTVRYYKKPENAWKKLENERLPKKSKISLRVKTSYAIKKVLPKVKIFLKENSKELSSYLALDKTVDVLETKEEYKWIYFFTSTPLKGCPNAIDFSSIISDITDIFKEKDFHNYHYNILTRDSFVQAIKDQTEIIHIFAQSGYDLDGKIFLCFEGEKGEMIKVGSEEFNTLLNSKTVQPFFIIITPFSEDVAEMLKQSGAKNFLVIYSHFTNDSRMITFTKKFYSFLFMGKTYVDSYKEAVSYTKTFYYQESRFLCCCSHSHTQTCPWVKKSKEEKVLNFGCRIRFKERDWPRCKQRCCKDNKNYEDQGDLIQIISYSEIEEDSAPFKVKKLNSPSTAVEHISINLNYSINLLTPLCGRNQSLITILENIDKKVFLVYGEKDIGKKVFSCYAGNYLYERGYVDKAILIQEKSINNIKSLEEALQREFESEAPGEKNQMTKETFLKMNSLIIIQLRSKLEEGRVLVIKELLEKYQKMKMILVKESFEELESMNAIKREEIIKVKLNPISEEECLVFLNDSNPELYKIKEKIERERYMYNDDLLQDLIKETKGQFNNLKLILKYINSKEEDLEKLIKDKIAQQEECIDLSLIDNDIKKKIIYLLGFSENGFPFLSMEKLFDLEGSNLVNLVKKLSPIVFLQRPTEKVSSYQIQNEYKEKIRKFDISPEIKEEVKMSLIEKFYLIFKMPSSLLKKKTLIDFGVFKNDNLRKVFISSNSFNYMLLLESITKRIFNKKTKEMIMNMMKDDKCIQRIEEISIAIPICIYLMKNTVKSIDALSVIDHFRNFFEEINQNKIKGKLNFLYAIIHSNTGVNSKENYDREKKDVLDSIGFFQIIQYNEGILECYLFLVALKLKYSLIEGVSKEDYTEDIRECLKYSNEEQKLLDLLKNYCDILSEEIFIKKEKEIIQLINNNMNLIVK